MNDWNLAQKLFEQALELGESERDPFLFEQANGDVEMVRRVQELLSADASPLGELSGTATDLLVALRNEPPAEELCGSSTGPYAIEAHLSSGGMGHVYRATRTSAGTARRVALKVLRPGLDAEVFLKRFQLERQTLAALEHEHIVSFLDAGALPDDRPYLVMEYVEGQHLTSWARSVPVRERLELFLQVLAAVQYAHQQLVVHRDLKPSNILVTEQGVPKLLDFGVAAMIETGEGGEVRPLTPRYAAPEQLCGGGASVIGDVFSLGVLLHELLTGEVPGEPGSAPPRGMNPDLAAIASRAYHQEPLRRYPSVLQLSEDLQRFLNGMPIAARPSSWMRRATLFVGRNRLPVALVAATILVVLTGWIGSELGRQRAQHDAGLGWGAHGQAKIASSVFEDWINGAVERDPELVVSFTQHLEEALGARLENCPEADVLVRLRLAELYMDSGEWQLAKQHAQLAWDLAQTTRGIGRRDKSRASSLLARLATETGVD